MLQPGIIFLIGKPARFQYESVWHSSASPMPLKKNKKGDLWANGSTGNVWKKASSRGVAFSVFSILDCFFFQEMIADGHVLQISTLASRRRWVQLSALIEDFITLKKGCPLLAAGFLGAFHQKIHLNNPCGDQHQFSPRKIDRLTGQSLVHLRCQWLLPGYLPTLQPHLRQTSLHLKSPPFWLANVICVVEIIGPRCISTIYKRLLKAERKWTSCQGTFGLALSIQLNQDGCGARSSLQITKNMETGHRYEKM